MRIRSIKPEFWTSQDIADHDWPTRLLFIGLWSYVDDNGVGRDVDKLVCADLFPLEDNPRDTLATVSRGLQQLHAGGQIERYSVDGKPFLHIEGWDRHQKIDRPAKPRYPLPTCENAIPRETLATHSRDPRDTLATGAVEQGNRGTGEKNKPSRAVSRKLPTPRATSADADGEQTEIVTLAAPAPSPVQALVAAYVDRVNGKATSALIGAVGRNIKRLIEKDHIEPALIFAAIEEAAPRGLRDLDRILAAPGMSQRMSHRDERQRMFARWSEITRELDERGAAS